MIRGRLIGSVQALRVTLQSDSHIEGDLTYQSLAIEQGAFFDGGAYAQRARKERWPVLADAAG